MDNSVEIGKLIIMTRVRWIFERAILGKVGMIIQIEKEHIHILFPEANQTLPIHHNHMKTCYSWIFP
jgi:hypothetical protein